MTLALWWGRRCTVWIIWAWKPHRTEFESWLCHLLAVRHWASYLPFLGLSFLLFIKEAQLPSVVKDIIRTWCLTMTGSWPLCSLLGAYTALRRLLGRWRVLASFLLIRLFLHSVHHTLLSRVILQISAQMSPPHHPTWISSVPTTYLFIPFTALSSICNSVLHSFLGFFYLHY